MGIAIRWWHVPNPRDNYCKLQTRWYKIHKTSRFKVDGLDRGWFLQKGSIMFDCPDPGAFRLKLTFLGDAVNRYGDDYAEMSRAEQAAQENYLLMAGVAPLNCKLTGYKDCKSSGFYFLFH